ncbi:MAG TPA: hypothetical protein VJT71_14425 [Pyrinomonadaceae bacterium]|nr:hypothetical protein [Pyrinomonadaceae bacterium]
MNANAIEKKFASIGARLKISQIPVRWRNSSDYAIDIQHDKDGQFFELRVREMLNARLDLIVLQAKPEQRHLLLLVRRSGAEKRLDRFLCGHDERAWFVAAVPGGASSVDQAKEALKPREVLQAQATHGLTARQRQARNNRAFRRQGEWFFIPEPELVVDPKLVLHNEPIRRGSGKPHWIEQLYRYGGTKVYVCDKHPNGVAEGQYRKLIESKPSASKWAWRVMQRGAAAYAKGAVRHLDHAVITLPHWHRVIMNTETQTRSMQNMAFLD